MVVVSGTFEFPAGTRDAVKAAMDAVVAETLKEDGCITYRFYRDLDDENRYRVFEEWASEETLAAHGRATHLQSFRETLKKLGVLGRDVKMYTVASEKQL